MSVPQYTVKNFKYGQIDTIEARSIPPGAASSALNWLTLGAKIELRRGYAVKGTRVTGTQKTTGIHVAYKPDGTQVLFYSYDAKVKYFDESLSTPDFTEIGSDMLTSAASGEDIAFANYVSLAGYQVWLSSPNSGLFKGMLNKGAAAVPPTFKDNYNSALNYKGKIKIKLSRMFLWARAADKTGIYLSYIDAQATTAVSAEILGSGDGVTKTFTGTLSALSGKRTAYAITATDGTPVVETFSDNYDGTLTGSAGGTGTINYSSGAISITFNAAPSATANNVTVSYNWEDSTSTGIADFHFSATRLAGQGAIYRQDDGGNAQSVETYKDTEYSFHSVKTWALTLGRDDTTATNLQYRQGVGIPNWRAAVATGSGIFFIDDTDKAKPRLKFATFDPGSVEVVPVPISNNLDLAGYLFSLGWAADWGDYILFGCRTSNSTTNNRTIVYHKIWKSLDVLDYYGTCQTQYNGACLLGDSGSPNVLEIFSGFDDDGNLIDNYWISGLDKLQIDELKKSRELWVRGEIQPNQDLDIYLALDNGNYTFIGTIHGDGSYVDFGQAISIGSNVLGKQPIGGSSSGGETAYNYFYKIKIRSLIDKFELAKIKFVATGIGYVSVSEYTFNDLTRHGQKVPSKYNV